MTFFQFLLLPFTWLYKLITDIRNWLYTHGYKKSTRFPLPVISVGNLTVGGTGKTPHVEYLVRLLKAQYKLVTLSRGYGRQTKGFLLAGAKTTASEIGDEPMQFYHKFSDQIKVAVGEKRAEAIPEILVLFPTTQVIILDDAYQHRSVKPSLSILLTDYNRPFYTDYVLPSGRLRERRAGADRADIIVVSKCPGMLTAAEKENIIDHIRTYSNKKAPVFFTSIRYGQPVSFGKRDVSFPLTGKTLLVSGLADARPLEAYVRHKYNVCDHIAFKDHHTYTRKDIDFLTRQAEKYQAQRILVTEKDYVKLMHPSFSDIIPFLPIWYLPIEVYFLFGEQQAFNEKVLNSLTEHP